MSKPVMTSLKVSAVVTAYNHEKYIAQCLDSILRQTGDFDMEIIVGDDCSTDNTRQIIQSYQEEHPGIIVILPMQANMGISQNIKRCIHACTGDYIAFCEGDDYWTDECKLQKQVRFLEEHQDFAMCFNALMYYFEDENRYTPNAIQMKFEKDYLTTDDLLKTNDIIVNFSCCMYRANVVRQLPDKLYDMPIADWMFNMACSRYGKLGFIRDWMSVWRIHTKGTWSGKSADDQHEEICRLIDLYNQYFNCEYDDQFCKLKSKLTKQFEDQLTLSKSLLDLTGPDKSVTKKNSGLFMRAIKHPEFVLRRLSNTFTIALSELITGTPSLREAQISWLQAEVQTRDKQIEYLRSAGQVRNVDLLILDTLFPHPLATFRTEEFCVYLEYFNNSIVLSTGDHLSVINESRSLDVIIDQFEKTHPEYKGRTMVTTHKIDGYVARMAYLLFLNNVNYFIDSLEENKIPFVFTLYPGGGFEINSETSDAILKRVLKSEQFRKVITTQKITRDYLIEKQFCTEDKIEFIFGGVMPFDVLEKSKHYKKQLYGFEKDTLDICFVSQKYMPEGVDKGYDIFIQAAKKLARICDNVRFHVVGGFNQDDIPVDSIINKITFYGVRPSAWFDDFYIDKDIILSPNMPFILSKGAFDGFPTACCVEAGLRKTAVFCTDELKLNNQFIDNEEIVIIPHNADGIANMIKSYYQEPAKLKSIGENGAAKLYEVFSYEQQMMPRINIIKNEINK